MRTIEVAAAVILRRDQCLLCSRPAGKELAGFWEFPGGKLEPGESPAQCLKRELREELAVEAVVFDILNLTEFRYETKQVKLFFLRTLLPAEAVIRPQERQLFRWVARRSLPSCRLLPADQAVAEYLAKI